MKAERTFKFWAGIKLWRPIRNWVEVAKFEGGDVKFLETKTGWFTHHFTIKGPLWQIDEFEKWLTQIGD